MLACYCQLALLHASIIGKKKGNSLHKKVPAFHQAVPSYYHYTSYWSMYAEYCISVARYNNIIIIMQGVLSLAGNK